MKYHFLGKSILCKIGGIVMKWIVYIIFFVLFLGVTFFGLGPVLFADGSFIERFITLGIVLLIYAVLIFLLRLFKKKQHR
jgi:hypothetical protein